LQRIRPQRLHGQEEKAFKGSLFRISSPKRLSKSPSPSNGSRIRGEGDKRDKTVEVITVEVEEAAADTIEGEDGEHPRSPHEKYNLSIFPPLDLSTPVGGRLQETWKVWEQLNLDSWVVETLRRGYKFNFVEKPPLTTIPSVISLPKDTVKREAMMELIQGLLTKRVVERVIKDDSPGFYSRFFVVPKPEKGKWRPILDLSTLNSFILKEKFKMDVAQWARPLAFVAS